MPRLPLHDPLRRGTPRFNKGLYQELAPPVPFMVWKQIMLRMMALIGEEILSNRTGFTLPAQLGLLVVEKIKRRSDAKKPFIDRIHFCKTGEKRINYNRHTFQHTYRIVWAPLSNTRLPTRTLWRFKASRALNRQLAQRIFAGQDYLPLAKQAIPHR
ncbi:hypothetical protein CLV58_109176 [Spirosoma oryzae]|uniref:Uncharacterized protein n=1 Tax=Spirosoma oryzae TaxID=1469603 RepID=A0A2T0SYI3_9BACT|nr:hypothetical protein [Spirosoma oryzae]PRY38449.1 hypothetical protein CLV58_109176 [Spirosoma oryzae]